MIFKAGECLVVVKEQYLTPIYLLIAAGVVWGAFNQWPAREYIVPAGVLFVINGVWLVVMTVRETPRE